MTLPTTFPILSLWQCWASLCIGGFKREETRGWPTSLRGTVVVHAAKRPFRLADYGGEFAHFVMQLQIDGALPLDRRLPYGAALGLIDITGCAKTGSVRGALSAQELAFGDYRDVDEQGRKRYAIHLANPRPFAHPIPLAGRQTVFWKWSPSGGDLDVVRAALR